MDANGKALSEMPAFQPYWGKPAVRNDRGDRGDVGIIRSPVRASVLPDCGGRGAILVPTAIVPAFSQSHERQVGFGILMRSFPKTAEMLPPLTLTGPRC